MRCQQQRRDRQSILMQGKENCHWRRSPTVPFPALVSVHVLLVRHQPCPTRCERQKMENNYTSTQEGPEVCGNGGRAAKTCTMRGQDGSQMFSLPSACTWCWRYFFNGGDVALRSCSSFNAGLNLFERFYSVICVYVCVLACATVSFRKSEGDLW